ncbi:MAG: transposase [Pseudomonadota bacterium]
MAGVSVAQVARRYAMNANMIHTWLKDPRFAPVSEDPVEDPLFLPVEIDGSTVDEPTCQEFPPLQALTPVSASRVDITLSDGRRILIEGPTALAAVVSLVQGLAV